MEIQEILHNIMEQQHCSPVYALFLLGKIQDSLKGDVSNAESL